MTELTPEQKMKLFIQERPWEDEPDTASWVDDVTGYKCTIWRHPTIGHLCGYVAIPKGHPLHGQGYDDINHFVEVHGGLTYCDEDKETGEWVVGFDCSHAGDFSPKLSLTLLKYTDSDAEMMDYRIRSEVYRDWAYVDGQVRELARQLWGFSIGVAKGDEDENV